MADDEDRDDDRDRDDDETEPGSAEEGVEEVGAATVFTELGDLGRTHNPPPVDREHEREARDRLGHGDRRPCFGARRDDDRGDDRKAHDPADRDRQTVAAREPQRRLLVHALATSIGIGLGAPAESRAHQDILSY